MPEGSITLIEHEEDGLTYSLVVPKLTTDVFAAGGPESVQLETKVIIRLAK